MHAPRELHVSVVSPEEAEFGTAEFWAGDKLFGFTRLEDGELVLRIEPRSDGGAVVVSGHSLAEALSAREAAPRIPVIRTTPTLLGESLLGPDLDERPRLPGLETRDVDSQSLRGIRHHYGINSQGRSA